MRTQVTPLIKSEALTAALDSASGREVYVKLDNLQPAGRFTSSQCCYSPMIKSSPPKRNVGPNEFHPASRSVVLVRPCRRAGPKALSEAAVAMQVTCMYLSPFFICICICICVCRDGDGLGRQGARCFSPPLCPPLHPW